MNNQPTCLGNRLVRAAILTVLILGALSLPSGDATRSGPLELRAAEQAPHVKSAVDGILDLWFARILRS